MNKIEEISETISSLNLERINVQKIEDKGNHCIVNITGGFNGSGDWTLYLMQIAFLVLKLDAWVIDLRNDCLDDVWYLRLGVNL